jgi:hypothetical protein
MCNESFTQAIDHGCNWNDDDIMYSELEAMVQREVFSAVAIYCIGPQKSAFISNIFDRAAIDITQLGCPQLSDTNFPTISCTFACHKSKQACVLPSA